MSHNLVLRSQDDEFPLVQTPSSITSIALRTGGDRTAVETYEWWLRGARRDLDAEADADDDYAPGWSWDPVTRHIAQINAFLAFAPGARFSST